MIYDDDDVNRPRTRKIATLSLYSSRILDHRARSPDHRTVISRADIMELIVDEAPSRIYRSLSFCFARFLLIQYVRYHPKSLFISRRSVHGSSSIVVIGKRFFGFECERQGEGMTCGVLRIYSSSFVRVKGWRDERHGPNKKHKSYLGTGAMAADFGITSPLP